MRPTTSLKLSNDYLKTGPQKHRFHDFQKSLSLSSDKVLYDKRVVKELRKYVRNERELNHCLEYLYHLTDDRGHRFSQSFKDALELRLAIDRFCEDSHPTFRWNKHYRAALNLVKRKLEHWRLSSISYVSDDSIRKVLPKENTHAGWTYILTGLKKKGENLEGIFLEYSELEREARRCGSFNRPMLPASRTQGSGEYDDYGEETQTCKHKTRLVLIVDLIQILAELKFAKPIIEAMKADLQYAGGMDDDHIRYRINGMRRRWNYFISMDYSKYDSSLSDWLIRDAFSVLRAAFAKCDDQLWEIVVNDFIHKNIVTSDGIVHSDKGVPSGSMFTQIIDSVCNWIMIETYFQAKSIDGEYIVMGDDNLFFSRQPVEVNDLATYVTKNFGVKVNGDKTSHGVSMQDPEFLSRYWKSDGAWRHPRILLAKLAYPERYRKYGKELQPELILYSYILAYPYGMNELMDVDKFQRMNPHLTKDYVREKVGYRYVSGNLRYRAEYLMAA